MSRFGCRCTLVPIARPIPSFRPCMSVCLEHPGTASTVRDRPIVTMGRRAYIWKSYPGYSADPSPTPYDHPFPQTRGWQPQSKLASQIAAKRYQIDTRVVCIDSLWELTSSLSNGTIVDPLETLLPPKSG